MDKPPERSLTFPYVVEYPPTSSRWHKPARWGRVVAHVVFFAAILVACLQVHFKTAENQENGRKADFEYQMALAEYEDDPTPANRQLALEAARRVANEKRHKGAIARWCKAVRQFWAGKNIYRPVRGAGAADPLTGRLRPGASVPPEPQPRLGASPAEIADADAWLHPNTPFVVILLTPLAYLPPQMSVAVVNVLKVLAVVAAIFWAASVTNHAGHRMGEWVVGLAVLLFLPLILGDFQHANTNTFVLAAVVGHLWLYRRGRDAWAGAVLALAICLKMTPVLFGAYWLYQRNWRLLGGMVVALAAAMVLIPLAALGPQRYDLFMGSWLSDLIVPGLIKGAPYPIHVNQSLSGVFSRLLMHGNLYYNPDDAAVAEEFAYVNFASIPPTVGRFVLLGIKILLLAVMAWAIGWRKLPRDDGRRGLHYGLVAAAILILNQRTWDHHATILLVAYLPLWYAIAYGRLDRARRVGSVITMAAAGLLVWGTSGSIFPERMGDVVEAYGPTFGHFLIVFVLCIVLLRALRAPPGQHAQPYARHRLPL